VQGMVVVNVGVTTCAIACIFAGILAGCCGGAYSRFLGQCRTGQ
jgi:hypothetical protein